jgi:hypothetical protein
MLLTNSLSHAKASTALQFWFVLGSVALYS